MKGVFEEHEVLIFFVFPDGYVDRISKKRWTNSWRKSTHLSGHQSLNFSTWPHLLLISSDTWSVNPHTSHRRMSIKNVKIFLYWKPFRWDAKLLFSQGNEGYVQRGDKRKKPDQLHLSSSYSVMMKGILFNRHQHSLSWWFSLFFGNCFFSFNSILLPLVSHYLSFISF